MNKKALIVGIVVILIVLIFVFRSKNNKEISEYNTYFSGNIVVNNVDDEYTAYDQNGKKIVNVTESEKYKLKIYEIDPNYEELPTTNEPAIEENIN